MSSSMKNMDIELVIIYNAKQKFVYFNYFGKKIYSPIEIHSPRWSIKDVILGYNIIEKLKRAKTFTLSNLREKNERFSFEILGKRDKDIKTVILEAQKLCETLGRVLMKVEPYRLEIRTSNTFLDTKSGYIDFHLYPHEWLQQEIGLALSRLNLQKMKKLLRWLLDVDTIKILHEILQEKSCSPILASRKLKINYQKAWRIMKTLEKLRILKRITNSPSLYEFSSPSIEIHIVHLILALIGIQNSYRQIYKK